MFFFGSGNDNDSHYHLGFSFFLAPVGKLSKKTHFLSAPVKKLSKKIKVIHRLPTARRGARPGHSTITFC